MLDRIVAKVFVTFGEEYYVLVFLYKTISPLIFYDRIIYQFNSVECQIYH